MPTRGILAVGCAVARSAVVNGPATAAAPISVMNSRRRIADPSVKTNAPARLQQGIETGGVRPFRSGRSAHPTIKSPKGIAGKSLNIRFMASPSGRAWALRLRNNVRAGISFRYSQRNIVYAYGSASSDRRRAGPVTETR